jgi:hypothetical protein
MLGNLGEINTRVDKPSSRNCSHAEMPALTSEHSAASISRTRCLPQSLSHCSSQQPVRKSRSVPPRTDLQVQGLATYHRPEQIILVLLVLLQGLLLVLGALDDGRDASLADILEDRLDLIGGGGLLGNVELELLAVALGLDGMVAGLVNCRTGCGIGRGSLQDVGHADRGRGLGRMEEGDDIEGFVLSRLEMSASTSRSSHDQSTHKSEHLVGIGVFARLEVISG